jgi:hypothetical protein
MSRLIEGIAHSYDSCGLIEGTLQMSRLLLSQRCRGYAMMPSLKERFAYLPGKFGGHVVCDATSFYE